jgi:pimeloyl-ACP methyl ester carboxylesterase
MNKMRETCFYRGSVHRAGTSSRRKGRHCHRSRLRRSHVLVHLLAASFAGGIGAYFAVEYPERVTSLVLINPLLNYKKRFVDDKPYWHDGRIDEEAGRELAEQGFLFHNPSFKLGRALLNEVFYLRPHEAIADLAVPTLFIHGTRDTFIPIESTRTAVQQLTGEVELLEIEGAQHGIAVFDDPRYLDPQTQAWQAEVVEAVSEWLLSRT